jgi:subtilisin family serine protease
MRSLSLKVILRSVFLSIPLVFSNTLPLWLQCIGGPRPANNKPVYVFDTGIRFGYPVNESISFVRNTRRWDDNGHGTGMIDIVRQVATSSYIVSIKVARGDSTLDMDAFARSVLWMRTRHPGIALLAFANRNIVRVLDELVRELHRQGNEVVVPAGNYGTDACLSSPSHVKEIWTVGALDRPRSIWPTSSRGTCVDAYAPALNVMRQSYIVGFNMSTPGTSVSSAIVAGMLASNRRPMFGCVQNFLRS